MERSDIDTLNHSASHVMASAIKKLYPEVKFAIGPSINNGFYYDFETAETLSPDDLKEIEKEMDSIINQDLGFEKEEISKDRAREIFKENPYKLELIDEIKDITVSTYSTGDFIDLCAGPHIDSTGQIKAFKLLSIAGAYWHGDEKNKMLTRVYGTAFFLKMILKIILTGLKKQKRVITGS